MPVPESGTLLERPLPYQPNILPAVNCGTGAFGLVMTNSGTVSVHFSIYANAYSTMIPLPFDVNPTNSQKMKSITKLFAKTIPSIANMKSDSAAK